MKAVSVNEWRVVVRTDWEVVCHVESVGVQSEASKRDPVVDIRDCGVKSAAGHPVGLRYCCENYVARESTGVLVEGGPAHPKLVARRQV